MVRLHRVAARMSAWLMPPELPTKPILWKSQSKEIFEKLSPYTAPISGYRGRHLASRLELRLPSEQGGNGSESASSSDTCRQHGLLQLRYPFSATTQSAYPPPLAQQYLLPLSHSSESTKMPTSASSTIPTRSACRSSYAKNLFTEDFDTYAADVAARHVDLHDKALVTAYLDSLVWYQHTHPHLLCKSCASGQEQSDSNRQQTAQINDEGKAHKEVHLEGQSQPACSTCQPLDLHLTGQVTWVGTSSLEVTIELTHDNVEGLHKVESNLPAASASQHRSSGPTIDLQCQPSTPATSSSYPSHVLVARARFIMAARDLSLKKAAPVAKLMLVNQAEHRLFQEGAARQKARHGGRKQEASQPLTDPVTSSMRDLIISGLQQHSSGQGSRALTLKSDHYRTVHSTVITKSFLTQFQERNTTGTVFGGQLLLYGQEMSELVTAALVGAPCELLFMRDVPFLSLVPLGHMVRVSGKVVATKGQLVVSHVCTFRSESALSSPTSSPQKKHHSAMTVQPQGTSQASAPADTPGQEDHGHPSTIQTHSFWCAFQAPDSVTVPIVMPMTLLELEQWTHAMHLCASQGL